jgi:hypothetical protein
MVSLEIPGASRHQVTDAQPLRGVQARPLKAGSSDPAQFLLELEQALGS